MTVGEAGLLLLELREDILDLLDAIFDDALEYLLERPELMELLEERLDARLNDALETLLLKMLEFFDEILILLLLDVFAGIPEDLLEIAGSGFTDVDDESCAKLEALPGPEMLEEFAFKEAVFEEDVFEVSSSLAPLPQAVKIHSSSHEVITRMKKFFSKHRKLFI